MATQAAALEDTGANALVTLAYNPCFVPAPAHDDHEAVVLMREIAAHCILSGHPEEWHAWAADHGQDAVRDDITLHLRGAVFIHEGDLITAEVLLHGALDKREQHGRPEERASTLVNLAEIALRRAEHHEAWHLLGRAIELAPHLAPVHINRHSTADFAGRADWKHVAAAELEHHLPDWREDTFLAAGLDAFRMHCTCLL